MAKRPSEEEMRQRHRMYLDPRLRPVRDRRGYFNNSARRAVDNAINLVHDDDPDDYHARYVPKGGLCQECLRQQALLRRDLAEEEDLPIEKPILMQIRDHFRDG